MRKPAMTTFRLAEKMKKHIKKETKRQWLSQRGRPEGKRFGGGIQEEKWEKKEKKRMMTHGPLSARRNRDAMRGQIKKH